MSRVIRISDETYRELRARRRTRGPKTRLWESWDAVLRRALALPDKHGQHTKCIEGFIVPGSAKFFPHLKDARGEAVILAVRKDLERPPKPIPVREVL